jgi:hypothetical protein
MTDATAYDPFAFARQEEEDARVLALFDQYLEAARASDQYLEAVRVQHVQDEDEVFNALCRRMWDIDDEIIEIPGGPTALAIKSYFFLKHDCLHAWVGNAATLRCPELFNGESHDFWIEAVVGIIRDAARQVPALAELVAPIIHEDASLIDADIEITWCRIRLADPPLKPRTGDPQWDQECLDRHAESLQKVRETLAKTLARLAQTGAKTARGAAIKAKHAMGGEGLT